MLEMLYNLRMCVHVCVSVRACVGACMCVHVCILYGYVCLSLCAVVFSCMLYAFVFTYMFCKFMSLHAICACAHVSYSHVNLSMCMCVCVSASWNSQSPLWGLSDGGVEMWPQSHGGVLDATFKELSDTPRRKITKRISREEEEREKNKWTRRSN